MCAKLQRNLFGHLAVNLPDKITSMKFPLNEGMDYYLYHNLIQQYSELYYNADRTDDDEITG